MDLFNPTRDNPFSRMAAYGSGGGWIKDTLQEQREDQLLKDQRYFDALAAQKKAAAEQQRIQDQRDYEEQQRTDQTALIAQMIMQQNPGLAMNDAVFEAQVMQDKTAAPILQQMRDEQEREQAARDAGWTDFEIQYYRETGKWPPTQKPRTPATVINTGDVPMSPEQQEAQLQTKLSAKEREEMRKGWSERFNEEVKLLDADAKKFEKLRDNTRDIAGLLVGVPWDGPIQEHIYSKLAPLASSLGIGQFDQHASALEAAKAIQGSGMELRQAGSGSTSDKEGEIYIKRQANLGNTELGNFILAAIYDDDAKRRREWKNFYEKQGYKFSETNTPLSERDMLDLDAAFQAYYTEKHGDTASEEGVMDRARKMMYNAYKKERNAPLAKRPGHTNFSGGSGLRCTRAWGRTLNAAGSF